MKLRLAFHLISIRLPTPVVAIPAESAIGTMSLAAGGLYGDVVAPHAFTSRLLLRVCPRTKSNDGPALRARRDMRARAALTFHVGQIMRPQHARDHSHAHRHKGDHDGLAYTIVYVRRVLVFNSAQSSECPH